MSHLEKIGKLQYKPSYIALLLGIPFIALTSFLLVLLSQKKEVDFLEEQARMLQAKASKTASFRLHTKKFLHRYSETNSQYLQNSLCNLSLLEKERRDIENILSHPAFSNSADLSSRLRFIDNNLLSFQLQSQNVQKDAQEKIFSFTSPVELTPTEIELILSRVENSCTVDKQAPQLIIKKLQLEKKPRKNYALSLEVIQRDFTKEFHP